jgi:hypothetical protein
MPQAQQTVCVTPSAKAAAKIRRAALHTAPQRLPAQAPKTPASLVLGATLAAAALGAAIQNGNGMLHGAAAQWLAVAVVAALFGLVAPRTAWIARLGQYGVPLLLMAGFVYAFSMWPYTRPALYVQPQSFQSQRLYAYALGAAAVLCGLSLNSPAWLRRLHLPMLVLLYVVLGCWLVQASPTPVVDVVTLTNESLGALLSGHNPFAITFANIYPDASHYPAGLVANGRVLFGYDYLPVNLLMAAPAYLWGDFRYSLVVANALSAVLLATLWPHAQGPKTHGGDLRLAFAALFLFTPRALLVLENGWTEPYAVLFLLATLWCCVRRPQLVPFALGLLLASKQYVVLLMASAYHLPQMQQMGRDARQQWAFWCRCLGTCAVVTVPFVLWSPAAFWHSVVAVPFSHPFRDDALNFLAWYKQSYGVLLPTALGFIACALASALAVWRVPRSAAGFAYSFGVVFLFFVAFNRQAFCNYYFLVIAAFCAAAALGHAEQQAR